MFAATSQKSRRISLSIFLTLSAIEGILSTIGMLRLPASEEDRALLLGYSPVRLGILLVHLVILSLLLYLAVRCWSSASYAHKLDEKLRSWFQRFEFAAAAIFAVMTAWSLGVLLLEFLLNPNLFPRSVLYLFLYERVRWPVLWSLGVSIQGVLLLVYNRWFLLKKPASETSEAPAAHNRGSNWGTIGLAIAVLINAGLWGYYNSIPTPNVYASIGMNIFFLLSFVLLFISLHFIARKRKYASLPDLPSRADQPRKNPWIETAAYALMLLWMVFMYIYTSFFVTPLPNPNFLEDATLKQVIFGFGFKQLQYFSSYWLIPWFIALAAGLWALRRYPQAVGRISRKLNEIIDRQPIWLFVAAVLFFLLTYFLRSNMISRDMEIYMGWLPTQFKLGMIHVRLDEMWESNLHSTTYIIMHTLFGWDVPSSYQILACLAAPFFLVLLYRIARRIVPEKAIFLVLFLMTGGYIQLLFGDMEYYSISITMVLAYFYVTYLYLRGEIAFPIPAMILALVMTFHMETLFLIPTLFFLSIVEIYRRSYRTLIAGWLGLASHISLTLLFFGFNGASLSNMRDTSWGLGRAGNVLANFIPLEPISFFSRLNMFAVIFPLIYFILLIFLFRRIHLSGFNAFLGVGMICGVPFALTWVSMIGHYSDWNLFSMPLFPTIFLFGYNLVRNVKMPLKKELVFSMAAIAALMTSVWIVQNHLIVR